MFFEITLGFGENGCADEKLAEALQATPVQWSQLEAAIRNAERFGLRSQVQEGRQVLKNLISEARQQLQKGIKQRSAAELHATIEQVQKLGIESLSGELEKARNIANTIDKEANLVKEFTVSSAALQKDEAMLLSQEEWDKAVQQLDSWIEEMRSMNMRDQTRTAKTALNGLKPQHQLHKMLTSALQLPAELSAAIDKTRPHSKSLVPVNRVLLEKANELLATNLDEFGARLELLGASEDSGAVESFIEELKSAGMYKGLMARPGVRETLNNAKKAAESLTRKQMALNEEVAASAKKVLNSLINLVVSLCCRRWQSEWRGKRQRRRRNQVPKPLRFSAHGSLRLQLGRKLLRAARVFWLLAPLKRVT